MKQEEQSIGVRQSAVFLTPEDEKTDHWCRKVLGMTLAVWGVFWTLLPLILLEGKYYDVLENLEWGRYWQFGYDKHPFVSMWISRAVYEVTGSPNWFFLLNQISVALAVLCVWLLSRRVLRPLPALAASLMTLTLQYFSSWALEFNNDVIAVSVWAAAMLFCHRAITGQKIADWCLTAFFCFIALMTKYYAAVLIGLLGLAVLCHKTGRKSFRHAGLYCAVLLFLALLLPHALWLVRSDFLPFKYAMDSSLSSSELDQMSWIMRNWTVTSSFFRRTLERLVCFIPVFLVLFWKRECPENRMRRDSFDRFYFTLIALGPLLVTLLPPLLGGMEIKTTWLASCFSLLAVWLFMVLDPVVTRRRIMLLLAVLGIYAAVLGIERGYAILWRMPYCDRKCNYEAFPGKAVAEKAEQIWGEYFRDRPRPLKYVVASRWEAVNVSYFGSSHPRSCFGYNFCISPWCSPEDLKRCGAIVVWEHTAKRGGGFLNDIPRWFDSFPREKLIMAGEFEFDRLSRPWFRKHVRRPIRKTRVAFAVLPPQPVTGKNGR